MHVCTYLYLSYTTDVPSISAEESYIQSLEKLNRHAAAPEPDAPYTKHDYFGDHQTSFELAVERYEQSLEGTIACRRELVQNMKTQMQVLYRVKVIS